MKPAELAEEAIAPLDGAGITTERSRGKVLASPIDAIGLEEAVARIASWGSERASRYVCACNVHAVVLAWRDPSIRAVIEDADLAVPDGMPVAWVLRSEGFRNQPRVAGPDMMWRACQMAEQKTIPIFLLGSTHEVLERLQQRLMAAFPALQIRGAISPPFRPLTEAEDRAIVRRINDSGAGLVFTAFGCPVQERWMAAHRGKVRATLIGVGAAFEFHSGVRRRAPLWMQRLGLEWLHRLASQPRRLWRRYLTTNPLFVLGFFLQLAQRNQRTREAKSSEQARPG